MKKTVSISVIILLITAAAICGFLFAREYSAALEEIYEYANIQTKYTSIIIPRTYEPDSEIHASLSETEESPEAMLPYVEVDFGALLLINPDTVGWIAIPGTDISYPVVQAADNSKYLGTSFAGEQSRAGALFADKGNNMLFLDANTIIYGHNMGAGRTDMFSALLSYKERKYFESHRYIQFDTIHRRHGFWEVFAVIELDVRSADFNYQMMQFDSDADFAQWIMTAKELSVHASDAAISPDSHIMTLSTYDSSKYGRSGRLLALAVRIWKQA